MTSGIAEARRHPEVTTESDHSIKRLHRIVGEINAWLVVIAIGLAMLDLVVLVALEMPAVPGKCLNCDNIAHLPDGTVAPAAAVGPFAQ
jgi:hypothetical protein